MEAIERNAATSKTFPSKKKAFLWLALLNCTFLSQLCLKTGKSVRMCSSGKIVWSWHVARGGRFPARGRCKGSPSVCLFQQFEEQGVDLWPHLFPGDMLQWVKWSKRACYPDRRQSAAFGEKKKENIQEPREAKAVQGWRVDYIQRGVLCFPRMSH